MINPPPPPHQVNHEMAFCQNNKLKKGGKVVQGEDGGGAFNIEKVEEIEDKTS